MRNPKSIRAGLAWRPRRGRTRAKAVVAAAGATILAAGTALAVGSPAGASAPAVRFAGSIARLPAGSGMLIVEAEVPSGLNAHDVPSKLSDIPVATTRLGRGAFSVAVPGSEVLSRAERIGNGWVNFRLIVVSGQQATSQYVPAALTVRAEQGSMAATGQVQHHTVKVPAFRAFTAASAALSRAIAAAGQTPDIIPPCLWGPDGNAVEDATRIGEVHVDQDAGSTDTFKYVSQADSSITVGVAASSGGFSTSGSVQISNTFSGSGSFPNGPGTLIYANGDFYYQKYISNGAPGCGTARYQVRATSAVGDAFQGFRQPAPNPYGKCLNTPYGHAEAAMGGGTFDSDRGTALGYNGIANLWGFQFGGSTGFSNDIYQDYTNNSRYLQYYCGTSYMPNPPVIYNADH